MSKTSRGFKISNGKFKSNIKTFSELANDILISHKPYIMADATMRSSSRKRTELNIIEEYNTEVYEADNNFETNSPKKLSKVEQLQEADSRINKKLLVQMIRKKIGI